MFPIAKLMFGKRNNWLICERGYDAQDNGFIFYKYLVDNHPEINATFLIKKTSPEFEKVSKIGRVIEFGSLKHFLMVIGYPVKISSHLFGYAPWVQLFTYYRRNKTHDRHIFLQHGITKNFHEGLCGDVCRSLDLFVCGAKPEYDSISHTFYYRNGVPQYTGFARFDLLTNTTANKQILVMPTWRRLLSNVDNLTFLSSDYYKEWNSLLHNKTLINYCRNNQFKIIFYLHYSLQKYSSLFEGNDVIEIIPFGQETVQNLLRHSSLLITDFSSVYFDFAYMNKPLVYFQFDESTFYDNHYTKGYFDYRRDGFGDVCLTIDDVIISFEHIVDNHFTVEKKYMDRADHFFTYRDNNNCNRIFDAIKRIKKYA